MKDKDTVLLENVYTKIYFENVNGGQGDIKIAQYPSNTDSSITHYISFDSSKNIIIDISANSGNIIERKEIDPTDIEKYSKWYSEDVFSKILASIK